MIPAHKLPPFNFVLRRWIARILRRRFHNVYVAGGEYLAALPPGQPVVGCVNHTNWWDGFVLYVLSHRLLPYDIYLAMEEGNLRRYRFFAWMGVFGMDLTTPRSVLSGLRHALRLLQKSGSVPPLVWIFVQGKLLSPRTPITVKGGATFLAVRAGAALLPVVLRYEWLSESRPSIFVRFGAPLSPDTSDKTLAETLNALLAETDKTVDPLDLGSYQPLFSAGMSMNKRWDFFVRLCLRRDGVFDKQNG